jgi:CheY-like chemotaxis protein
MGNDTTILIVDDNSTMRTIIRHILEHAGYTNIIEDSDGTTAFRVVKSRKIDLIISDWNMHAMTGIEFLKKVREDNEIGKTPFLMVTVEGLEASRETAFQCGVSGFIAKPFHVNDLLEIVEKVLENPSS